MKTFRLLFPLIAILLFTTCGKDDETPNPDPEPEMESFDFTKFTFLSNGVNTKGKIYLPASHATNTNLHAIYLIDYQESHFTIAKDEFDQVIKGVEQIDGFEAMVVTLEEHLSIDATAEEYLDYYNTFKDMTVYVDSIYTNNTDRTFIGRGSEAGVALLTMFGEDAESSVFNNFIVTDPPPEFTDIAANMVQTDNFPENISNKKLHFSFSSSNERSSCIQFIDLINSKQYPWLTFESRDYEPDVFINVYTYSFAHGLNFIFL